MLALSVDSGYMIALSAYVRSPKRGLSMRFRKRLADLEARIEALEHPEPSKWTEVPASTTFDMDPTPAIWPDLEAPVPFTPMWDDEDWKPGVYL